MKSAVKLAAVAVALVVSVMYLDGAEASVAPTVVPKTHEVVMTNEGGTVRFEPKELTIAAGDTVKWVLTGGSHNVVFWADSLPAGALPLLRAAMKDTVASLATARFRTAGESYSVVFAGMPKGAYKYYCDPHLGRGMAATITVQ